MRVWWLAFATTVLTVLVAMSARAAGDTVVVNDSHMCRIFAFRGTLVYGRGTVQGRYCGLAQSRPWMRIVNGRLRGVHGIPRNANVGVDTQPIGLDSGGRVVLAFWTRSPKGQRWWVYDIAADTARRVKVRVPEDCDVAALAVWRSRTAYVRICNAGSPSGLFIRVGTHSRRLRTERALSDAGLVMLGTTVAGTLTYIDDEFTIVGLMSTHDRWCGDLFRSGDFQFADVWLAPGRMIWLTYTDAFYGDPLVPLGDAVFRTVALNGHCNPGPTTELYDLPDALHAQAVAVDAPFLYHADDNAIFRHLLIGP